MGIRTVPDPAPDPTSGTETDTAALLRACLWMIGAVISFTAMAIAGREISVELDTFEIMMYRSAVGLVLVLGVGAAFGRLHRIRTSRLGVHVLRNIFHFAGQNLWFYAVATIPLAHVFALEFTTPLWVLLLAPLFLGERLTRLRVLAALAGFIGILIVARPSPDTLNAGTIAAAAASIGFAGTMIMTKRLTRHETLTGILFWMTLLQLIFGILLSGFDGDIALPSAGSAVGVLVIGLGGIVAHLCLTSALSIAPATIVTPVDFARLPIITILGFMLYQEPVDVLVILGAILIFGANYVNIWAETRKKR